MASDKRREVAERLRGPFDVCQVGRYTYLSGTLCGMQVAAGNESKLRKGMRDLADLVDPRSWVVRIDVPYRAQHYPDGRWLYCCVACSNVVAEISKANSLQWRHIVPRFCPHCGARLQREPDKEPPIITDLQYSNLRRAVYRGDGDGGE